MDKKEALEMVNALLEDAKKGGMKSAVAELLTIATSAREQKKETLKKAINEVQEVLAKIDPTTKLPGTLLDKQDMGMNITPQKQMSSMGKAAPDANSAMDKRAHLANRMKKCMVAKNMPMDKASSAPAIPAPPAPAMSMPKPKMPKLPTMKAPAMGKTDMAKDDMTHSPNSPEDKAHDIVEEGQSVQDAAQDLGSLPEIQKMFNHLRNRKKDENWERSPENRQAGMEKGEESTKDAKNISKEAERAIVEPSDKPIKIGKERPGQANKPPEK